MSKKSSNLRHFCYPPENPIYSALNDLDIYNKEQQAKVNIIRKNHRMMVMRFFCEELIKHFQGTPAISQIEQLVSTWEKFKYNKEVPQAIIMVLNVLEQEACCDIEKEKEFLENLKDECTYV